MNESFTPINKNVFRFDNQNGGENKTKYVDLKMNGRLFPTWLLRNFNKYKLKDIVQDDSDPCNKSISKEIKSYQLFLTKYMDFNGSFKDILIYHGLGSGKTRSAINIYNMLYNYTPGWNVFILLKATLKDSTWVGELEKWLSKDEYQFRSDNIIFISYDAPNADKLFQNAIQEADSAKKSLYIIEECHNFISNVYSNVTSKQGKRASFIYDYIIQDKKENDSTRVICISGTPAINYPFELALLFNLLRPGIFPKSESEFNQIYVSNDDFQQLIKSKKNSFQRRILGLVSYYIGATPDFFASKNINYIDVKMSEYQDDIYSFFEEKEIEAIMRAKRNLQSSQSYKTTTRQASNFVFPNIAQNISGETRPKASQFKISKNNSLKLDEGKKNLTDFESESEDYYNVQNYKNALNNFIQKFKEYLDEIIKNDKKKNYTISDDFSKIIKINSYEKFIESDEKKSELFNELYKCSSKMLNIIANIFMSPGPVLIYSNFVNMEGFEIFKIYLKKCGFSKYVDNLKGKDNFRYMEYHGLIDFTERKENLKIFNLEENKYGKLCKIIMISQAGTEGISVFNIRQVHIMEPFWHEIRIEQMIGRAIRLCSHKNLPIKERHVEVYRYKSVRYISKKMSTDQYIEDIAKKKSGLINSFLDAMKEAAIDCELNKAHNKIEQNFRCFQFDEKSLFQPQIAPAYKLDIYDDFNLDNGLNSSNSSIKRIKAMKISAVIKLSKDSDEDKYSESQFYWYCNESSVVYDFELHIPVGKVGIDDQGLPMKLDNNNFIITYMLPIPIIDK